MAARGRLAGDGTPRWSWLGEGRGDRAGLEGFGCELDAGEVPEGRGIFGPGAIRGRVAQLVGGAAAEYLMIFFLQESTQLA